MADTVTSSRELKLIYEFDDGDNRTTSLSNPRANITGAEINQVSATLLATQAFVSDKNYSTEPSAFVKISEAKVVNQTRRQLDLSNS